MKRIVKSSIGNTITESDIHLTVEELITTCNHIRESYQEVGEYLDFVEECCDRISPEYMKVKLFLNKSRNELFDAMHHSATAANMMRRIDINEY